MVNTFIPYPDFVKSAKALDYRRLGKQRVEAWQILRALMGISQGWRNHPAAKMWEGHEKALALYATTMCDEWLRRGYKSTMIPKIEGTLVRALELGRISDELTFPYWFKDKDTYEQIASTHRIALLRKEYEWYSQFGWPEDKGYRPEYYQYLWPDVNGVLQLGTYNNM